MQRRCALVLGLVLCAVAALFAVADSAAEAVELQQRILYNFDGDGCMWTKANGEVPTAIDVEDVRRLIDEIAYEGSKVNTMLVCINAQVMYYPTEVGTMRGTICTPEQRANWPANEIQRFENMNNFYNAGIDPYAVMLAEAKQKGLEALLTFRMNDAHGQDYLKTQFWADHPEYRLGEGLDFGHVEVRDHIFNLIQEAVQRYDSDGIELDFNRFPTFFDTGTTEERIAKINSLTGRVRDMLDVEGAARGKHLILTARVPSNYGTSPPTYATSRAIGCDPVAWVENGWIDYLTVSEWFHEKDNLPIEAWKDLITEVPVYGGIEYGTAVTEAGCLTPDEYRLAAQRHWEKGADGIYLFNFVLPRTSFGREPYYEVLADLGTINTVPGTVAHWTFDGGTIGTRPTPLDREPDSGDYGRDAFAAGWPKDPANSYEYVAGSPAYGGTVAAEFSDNGQDIGYQPCMLFHGGFDDFNDGGPAAWLDIRFSADDSFTVEAVFRTAEGETGGAIVSDTSDGYYGTDPGWALVVGNPVEGGFALKCKLRDGTNVTEVLGTIDVADGKWHHVALVRDGTNDTVSLYVDYLLDTQAADTTSGDLINTSDIAVARVTGQASLDEQLYGAIDFVRISDVVLGPDGFVMPNIPGDASLDGIVDAADVAILAANWQTLTGANWCMGDFNSDGAVNDADATLLAANWLMSNSAGASVPEPGTLALLAGALATRLMLVRKKR